MTAEWIDWARIARQLFESSWGRVLPGDLEGMTIDQVLCLLLPAWRLGAGPLTMSEGEAAARGYIEPQAKSLCQQVKEQVEAEQAAASKLSKQARRAARRARKEAANV